MAEVDGNLWRSFTQPFTQLKKGHVEHTAQD